MSGQSENNQRDPRNGQKPQNEVHVRRAAGITTSGRALRRTENLPDKRESEEVRAQRLAREEAEWNRGVVRVKGSPDRIFLTLVLILLCLGTVMVFSASYPSALAKEGDSLYYVKRQFV